MTSIPKKFDELDLARKACVKLKKHIRGEALLDDNTVYILKDLIRGASKTSLFFFAKYVLGFSLLTDQTHKRWCDDLQVDFWKYNNFMRLKPRKSFKTSVYAEAFILWLWAVISPELHIFYTSSNGTLLSEVSAHLDYYLAADNTSLYSFIFGIRRDVNLIPNTTDTYNIIGKKIEARGSSLMFRTAGGSVNGVHPHVVITDDACDLQDRESSTIRQKKKRWFESIFPLLHEYNYNGVDIKKIMYIGTRWHLDDLPNHIIEKNKEIEFEEDRFDIEVESIYQLDGSLQYPEFFGEEKIRKIKAQISDVFFATQYLNNPLPEGLQIFDKTKLHFFDITELDIKTGRGVCLLDPAKGTKDGDYPAVIWINFLNGVVRIFDAIDKKVMLDDMLKLIARKNIDYGIPEMIYESNGTMLMEKNIQDAHKLINPNYYIKINGINEGRNKNERIVNMQPNLYNGSVRFRNDYEKSYPELMNQVIFYPAWGHDDFPDIVEKAIGYLLRKKFDFVYIGADGEMPTHPDSNYPREERKSDYERLFDALL